MHWIYKFTIVKSGPAVKCCISGCRSPNEIGVKSTVFRNNHSLGVSSSGIGS